jgi:hypothetical protein
LGTLIPKPTFSGNDLSVEFCPFCKRSFYVVTPK